MIARKIDVGPFDGHWRGVAEFISGPACHGRVGIDMRIKDSRVSGGVQVRANSHGTGMYRMSGTISPAGALVNTHAGRQFVFKLEGGLEKASGRGSFTVAGLCTGIWSVKRSADTTRSASAQPSQTKRQDVSRTQPVRAQLVELQALRDQGLITAREAATKREQILSSLYEEALPRALGGV